MDSELNVERTNKTTLYGLCSYDPRAMNPSQGGVANQDSESPQLACNESKSYSLKLQTTVTCADDWIRIEQGDNQTQKR